MIWPVFARYAVAISLGAALVTRDWIFVGLMSAALVVLIGEDIRGIVKGRKT